MINMRKYQTTASRIGAAIIDSIVFLPVGWVCRELMMNEPGLARTVGQMLETVLWGFYVVIGHGKYGQTLGKKMMQIQVLDLGETKFIGYRRAILRESFWFALVIASFIYGIFFSADTYDTYTLGFDDYLSLVSLLWFVTEITSMLFNDKKRALHDFMAGSVVVKTVEMAREKMLMSQDKMTGHVQSDDNLQKDTL